MSMTIARPLHFAGSIVASRSKSNPKKVENAEVQQEVLNEERAVVERILGGDKNAYRVLVDRYQSRALAVAIGIVGNRDDAEELVQQAFLKAYTNLESFRGQSSFYTWLYRILFNLSVDLSRKAYRRSELQVDEGVSFEALSERAGTNPEQYLGHIASPEEAFERGELREAFAEALSTLTPEHRTVLMLREVDGLSYSEISDAVGCSKGTVMSRLHHARRKMQGKLRELLSLPGKSGQYEEGIEG
jgi:RNA polymerase sigma-70 factor (ECF subfamily)